MGKMENGNILSDAEKKQVEEALEAKPHVLEADDIKFEKGEEDVRKLKAEDYRQIDYKFMVTQTALLHNIAQSMVDVQRLLMLVLRKQGVEDIAKELLGLYEELKAESEQALKKDA